VTETPVEKKGCLTVTVTVINMYGLPYLITHINSLERVQRNFTKRISELPDLSYQDRLTALNLETLEHRRLSCVRTMYYKVFHNITPLVPRDYFNVIIPPYDLHSVYHDFNTRKPLCRTNTNANDIFTRCVSAWNSFPSVIFNSNFVAAFKRALRSLDLSLFLNYAF